MSHVLVDVESEGKKSRKFGPHPPSDTTPLVMCPLLAWNLFALFKIKIFDWLLVDFSSCFPSNSLKKGNFLFISLLKIP